MTNTYGVTYRKLETLVSKALHTTDPQARDLYVKAALTYVHSPQDADVLTNLIHTVA